MGSDNTILHSVTWFLSFDHYPVVRTENMLREMDRYSVRRWSFLPLCTQLMILSIDCTLSLYKILNFVQWYLSLRKEGDKFH